MKIRVLFIHPTEGVVPATHDGDWVDADTHDGELAVTTLNRDGAQVGYTRYAKGAWLSFRLDEPASDEMLRVRAAMAEQNRTAPPPNGSRAFG